MRQILRMTADKDGTGNCSCKYDDLYSVVGSKLLLGRFTKLSTVSANVNARGYITNAFLTVS